MQEREHLRRVYRVRPIIDRKPDFAVTRFKMGHHSTPALTVCGQGWIKQEQMRKKKDAKREPGIKGDHRDEEHGSKNGKAKDEPTDHSQARSNNLSTKIESRLSASSASQSPPNDCSQTVPLRTSDKERSVVSQTKKRCWMGLLVAAE